MKTGQGSGEGEIILASRTILQGVAIDGHRQTLRRRTTRPCPCRCPSFTTCCLSARPTRSDDQPPKGGATRKGERRGCNSGTGRCATRGGKMQRSERMVFLSHTRAVNQDKHRASLGQADLEGSRFPESRSSKLFTQMAPLSLLSHPPCQSVDGHTTRPRLACPIMHHGPSPEIISSDTRPTKIAHAD